MSLFPEEAPEPSSPEEQEPVEIPVDVPAPTAKGNRQRPLPTPPPGMTWEATPAPALQLTPLLHEATEDGRYHRHTAGGRIAATLANLRELRQENPDLTPRQLAQLAREPATGLRDDLIERLAALDTAAADPRLLEEERYLLNQDLLDGRDGKVATEAQVADFLAMAANPGPDSRVLDLCCGSGRLLVHAWLHMLRQTETGKNPITGRLQGIERNMDLAEAAATGLRLHGITGAGVAQANSLNPEECHEAGVEDGQWDFVITNLPLGLKVRKDQFGYYGRKPEDILYTVKSSRARMDSEILMLQRVRDLLAPGHGRAALIVSDGLLSNSSDRFARDWMMNHLALEGVISLPRKSRSSATAKTSVLLLRRMAPGETQADESQIFMAICENDGHDGRKETSARYAIDQKEGDTQRIVMLHNDLVDYMTAETRLSDGSWRRTRRIPVLDANHASILSHLNDFRRDPAGWESEQAAATS